MKNEWFSKSFLNCAGLPARMLILVVLVFAPVTLVFARMYEEPVSFTLQDKSMVQIERKILPKLDIERLLAEDRERGKNSKLPVPLRFAVVADVSFTPDNSGTWQTVSNGQLWRLRIQAPGAKNLNLGITHFELPKGGKLWVYDPGYKHVEGPYTSRNRSRLGSLWTPIIEGDEIVVEIFIPTGSKPAITIGKVSQGYRGLSSSGEKGGLGGTEGACNNDVICPEGDLWRDQIRAVGVYTFNVGASSYICTGTLMNDTAYDFKPYFLTANHCTVDGTNDSTVVVYWNFQSATCGTHGPGSLADNQTGSIFRAAYAPSDVRLLELSASPDPGFNVYHAGWDASGAIPAGTVGIHQPSGDVKAISISNSAPDTTGSYWYVAWSSGVTEGGSSGSCLFDAATKRCIGQLQGGNSVCGGADLTDYYGRLSVSWLGGGTDATQLKHWLDPGNTGVTSLNGDPHITTVNGIHYDFQGAGEYVSLRDNNGLEIQTRHSPIATTFNPGSDPHDGLATCVSLNTAVAARVGKHRVTYQPNLSGKPDPSGLQLRIDGVLTTLAATGQNLAGGGRIAKSGIPGGLEIHFPDTSILYVTPGWWASQSKWYLNVDIVRPKATDGASPGNFPAGGIAGAIAPTNWLPALPDGSSMGTMPASLHDRYVALYQKFGEAWRVTDNSSLFDYAQNTSTQTFTMREWPMEKPPCVIPKMKPARPVSQRVALAACIGIKDKATHANCVFDVRVTGNQGFAKTYLQTIKLLERRSEVKPNDRKVPINRTSQLK